MRTDIAAVVRIVNGIEVRQVTGVEETADKTIDHRAEIEICSRIGVEATEEVVLVGMRLQDTKRPDKRSEKAQHHHLSPKSLLPI